MELKKGTEIYGIRPELIIAAMVAKEVVNEYGYDFVITSCTERDVKHSKTSLHWSGNALDMRTRDMKEHDDLLVRNDIADRLGKEFDVILESNHIHIEFQPEVG